MITNKITKYLRLFLRDYLTKEFGYSSYTPPNTMFDFNNKLPELLLTMSNPAVRMWLRTVSLLKRNIDPVKACTVEVYYKRYEDLMSRATYYRALKELLDNELLISIDDPKVYIVNILMANKLYKPKLDI